MKKLRVKVCCSAYYETTMEVPDNLDFNEAITYAQKIFKIYRYMN